MPLNIDRLIERTKTFVQKELEDAEGGHDWFHIERVYNNALAIAEGEKADRAVVALAALLHDIADAKFHDGDETLGPKKASDFLSGEGTPESIINHVVAIIENVSFKGGNTTKTFDSLELRVVQDADRLDALGAIGIARTFNYGGFKNRSLYDPSIPPKLDMTPEEYRKSEAPTINHFYEKLLLLKDRMHTIKGRELAEMRHRFMEDYLSRFYAEWNGKA